MDWNVVVTAYDWRGLRSARRLLSRYGEVARTEFHNVLVLKVADVAAFLEAIAGAAAHDVSMRNDISRVMPAQATFAFATTAQFQEQARTIARQWADRMGGRSFHARLHRRRGDAPVRLSAQAEERSLNDSILERLCELGQPGRIDFQDPDYVLDIETVGQRAGMSLWSRDDLKRFPFLRVD
ncbi:MAG: THUMP domain-containing protein [Hyphomicrobiaceae bacterium]